MRLTSLAAPLFILSSSLLYAAQQAPSSLPNGLERMENARVALAYVRPGTDWGKYKTIELRALSIPPKVRDATPANSTKRYGESYTLPDKDVATLQKSYAEITRDVLTEAGFTLVDTAQADTLVILPQIINIELKAPIESSRAGYGGRSKTFSEGGGSIAMQATLADGATNVVVAEAADRKYATNVWGVNSSVGNLQDTRRIFAAWARQLRDRLRERPGATK